ncbi:DNA damage-inducible protein 1 [Neurospora crassa]|uniref:DNA damage-inducible protein 1 n=1 Tax=Neurospora crassa (strain ATCC 24698 / 74-OR23-1A / CBS 708.71 / DSM 1257 / FGSC 987) TaxID=367110 RepID=DDI1_NEUCR|nr:DNA damage-inducible protein 1 [Neurospora crassa OR74A]Q7S906.2 RecName: Full=DNA damage-inducible protein 1 [Neurospora crassa OR74A]EAA32827.3 DNA damage-inducible protein 1 [Neurospora crassa OR74A]KHE84951.1 DNA damage-inducible protein 1 [Neurospora crassa]|eukprot:XP_962063.3 DNA damage-inducible protein 1 [Neurospora crassa OR74A]
MQITIAIQDTTGDDQDFLSLQVFPDMTLETLRNSIQAETSHHPSTQHLYHNGNLITDNSKTLTQLNVTDGDMLALHVRETQRATAVPESQQGRPAAPPQQDPEFLRLQFLANPALRAEVERTAPDLAAAINDPQRWAQLFRERYDREQRERAERHRIIQQLNEDPFNPEAQARIEEIIRQERVTENLQTAMEHNPEVFGTVHMLYLDVEVNGAKVKALVDSGAQATIMSPDIAEACGIMRLVDKRYGGIAKGVGTAKIIGRVHTAPVKIGSLFLPCSFTVMEGKNVDMLLGLDMLKRYQACIDLAKNALVIQGEEIPFLGEADIPKATEEALQDEPTIEGPGGTTIGQRTGAVSGPGTAQHRQGQAGPSTAAQPGPSAPAPAPASASAPAPRAPQARSFPREHIEQLVALGADEQKAIRALEATDGNVEYAASLIFEGF